MPPTHLSWAAMTSERRTTHDIFISYAHADDTDGFVSALRDAIAAEMAAFVEGGVDVCFFDKSHIYTMADWETTILSGLRSSRLLLVVLSPNYFLSPFCRREWREFTRLGSEEALANILGDCATVYIEPCTPFDASEGLTPVELAERLFALAQERTTPPERAPCSEPGVAAELAEWAAFLRRPQRVDLLAWRDKGVDALKDEVVRQRLKGLTERLSRIAGRAERRRASPTTMPRHSPSFVGRVAELRELRNVLAVDRPEGTVAVIQSAFAGIGKSGLAFEYAHVFGDSYPGGRWLVRAEGISDMATAFIRLGRDLGMEITERDEADPDRAFRKVRKTLQEGGERLIVFDNVDRPELFKLSDDRALPDADRVHILATTRLERDRWPTAGTNVAFMGLGALSVEDGLRLLATFRTPDGDVERAAASAIAEDLAGHPFSLEVVGAFLTLDANQATTYRGFYEHEIKAKGLTLSLDVAGGAVMLSRHDQSVITELLRPVFSQLSADERLVLDYAALMDPDQVILPMLRDLAGKAFPVLMEEGPEGMVGAWDRLTARLSALRLLTPQDEGEAQGRLGRLHRLLGTVLREQGERVVDLEMAVLQDAFAREEGLSEFGRVDLRWMIAPLVALASVLGRREGQLGNKARLLSNLGERLVRLRRAGEALVASAEAEHIRRRLVAAGQCDVEPNLAITLSNKGKALHLLRRAGEALDAYAEAEDIQQRLVEAGQYEVEPDFASTLNNKGLALRALNCAGEALGTHTEAERIYRRLVKAGQREVEPDFAGTLSNKGSALRVLCRVDEALGAYAEAEDIQRRLAAAGQRESETELAGTLGNMGNAYWVKGCAGEALDAHTEAERIYRRLAEDGQREVEPDLAGTLINMGNALQALCRGGEALDACVEAENIQRRLVESGQREVEPDLAKTLSNKGIALQSLNRAGEALDACAKAERIQRRLVESEQREVEPDLAGTLVNMGNAYWALDRAGEALGAFAEAERIYRRLAEAGHREVELGLEVTWRSLSLILPTVGHGNLAARLARFVPAMSEKAGEKQYRIRLWLLSGPLLPKQLWLAIGFAIIAVALATWSPWALIVAVPMGLASLLPLFAEASLLLGLFRTRNFDFGEIRMLVDQLEAGNGLTGGSPTDRNGPTP